MKFSTEVHIFLARFRGRNGKDCGQEESNTAYQVGDGMGWTSFSCLPDPAAEERKDEQEEHL